MPRIHFVPATRLRQLTIDIIAQPSANCKPFFYFFPAMCDDCIVAERDSDEPIDDQRAVCPHSRRHSFFPTSSCIQYTVGRVRSQILMQNGLSWFGGKSAYFPASLFKRLDGAGTEARKAAVSARKAEDHAERRRPVNQPRGRNRRESAPFDSARRCGLLLPKSYPLARNAVVGKEDLLNIPLILHRRIGLQQEIAHWAQIEIERLHVAATYNVLVGDPSATVQSGLGYLLITDDHLPKPQVPSRIGQNAP